LTKTKIVFVDKVLQNIRILKNFYTEATILLCVFHVLKWLRGKIFGDKYYDRDAKDAIWALVYSLVYAKTEAEYNRIYLELIAKCKKHEKVDQKETPFSAYFDKNWHSLEFRALWAFYLRADLQTLGTTSSNILESYNGKIKHRLNTNMHLTAAIEELMVYTEERYLDYTRRDCYSLKVSVKSWALG
jgi:hypothetical protein